MLAIEATLGKSAAVEAPVLRLLRVRLKPAAAIPRKMSAAATAAGTVSDCCCLNVDAPLTVPELASDCSAMGDNAAPADKLAV